MKFSIDKSEIINEFQSLAAVADKKTNTTNIEQHFNKVRGRQY